MKNKCEIEFLVSGEITWTSPSGKRTVGRRVNKGDRLRVRVVKHELPGTYELFDGKWSILIEASKFRLV